MPKVTQLVSGRVRIQAEVSWPVLLTTAPHTVLLPIKPARAAFRSQFCQ